MKIKTQEINCLLIELGVLEKDGRIAKETLLEEVKGYIKDDVLLRKDLTDGLIKCEEKSRCQAGVRADEMAHLQLSRALDFYKCYEGAKTEACVKKDIRTKVTQQLR